MTNPELIMIAMSEGNENKSSQNLQTSWTIKIKKKKLSKLLSSNKDDIFSVEGIIFFSPFLFLIVAL